MLNLVISHAGATRWFAVLCVALTLGATAAAADPSLWKTQGWSKTDFSKTSVPFGEILSGGPPKDGIPSIDRPKFSPVAEIKNLTETEPVIGLEIKGDARAYPLRVMTWHEIVTETVGGQPVSVTYGPLCNAAIVFDRTVSGRVLDFGTTGKLRKSDLVMYDRQTESWWQQFTGEAIVGDMLGQSLDIVPARLESFADFKARHPNGQVLIPNNPEFRDYGRNPYAGYDKLARPFLYAGPMPEGIAPMARVVVIKPESGPIAIALTALREKKSVEIEGIRLSWKPGQVSALDDAEIPKGRDVGTVSATRASSGKPGELIAYDVTFAFVFHAFHQDRPLHKDAAALK